jgi:SAM-dependent methyltransferase
MSGLADQEYLRGVQYRRGDNLEARIALHRRFSTNRYGWFRWVFDHLRAPEAARVLDVGCGTARLWRENAARIPTGWRVTLADLSPGMVAEAQVALRDLAQICEVAVLDAQAIPYANSSFDAVLANHMLYHVPDVSLALSEIRRVLADGGRLYAATNGRAHLSELDDLLPRQGSDFGGANGFTLENGAAQIKAYFPWVSLHRYDDGLEVTEAEPLIAYLLSERRAIDIEEMVWADLTERLKREIERRGAIHITKNTSLFEASMDRRALDA